MDLNYLCQRHQVCRSISVPAEMFIWGGSCSFNARDALAAAQRNAK